MIELSLFLYYVIGFIRNGVIISVWFVVLLYLLVLICSCDVVSVLVVGLCSSVVMLIMFCGFML